MKQFTCLVLLTFLFPGNLAAQIEDERGLVAAGAEVIKLGEGFSFTEGPVADKKGNVYFTDQPNNKIIRWSAKDGRMTVFSNEAGRSNGMFFDAKGRLVACADGDNELWAFDKKGRSTVWVKGYEGKALNGPNDLWIDPKGGIYFTDPLYKRDYWKRSPERQQDGEHVYYLYPDRKTLIRVDEKLVRPNGIIGTPDGRNLYVADIGDKKIYVYTINPDGTLGNRSLFTGMGSDGMTLDEQGNLYLTGDGVTVFDKHGAKIAHFFVKKGWTANACFGGKDRKMLFITAGDAVYGLKMNVKGAF